MAPGRSRARSDRDGVVRARTALLRYPRLRSLRLGSRGSRQAAAADGFHREVPLRSHTEDPGTRPQSRVSGGSDESDREKEDSDATNHGGRRYMRSAVASRCDPGLIQIGWRQDSLATVVATVRMAIAWHRWPPMATQAMKPQEGHPPGASRIALSRRYFEGRLPNQ
jgi:hypothetical protein